MILSADVVEEEQSYTYIWICKKKNKGLIIVKKVLTLKKYGFIFSHIKAKALWDFPKALFSCSEKRLHGFG